MLSFVKLYSPIIAVSTSSFDKFSGSKPHKTSRLCDVLAGENPTKTHQYCFYRGNYGFCRRNALAEGFMLALAGFMLTLIRSMGIMNQID
jgi:hypothetical protein